ncbi:MAG: XdhC family protein [Pseudomonadota bacterium]
MDPQVLKKLNQARGERKAAVVVTDFSDGRNRIVLEGEAVEGALGEAIAAALRSGKSAKIDLNGRSVFLNAYVPSPRMVVIGAVHISQALVPMADVSGYETMVIDPRTAFATEERFGNIRLFADWPEDVLADKPLDAYTALVAVTHDPKIDDTPLLGALEAGCFYVGALGSRKTHAKRVQRLIGEGASEEQLSRIKSPIGLDIGAASPEEIAVAIMAEVIRSFRARGNEVS